MAEKERAGRTGYMYFIRDLEEFLFLSCRGGWYLVYFEGQRAVCLMMDLDVTWTLD